MTLPPDLTRDGLEAIDGELAICGERISDIADRAGRTPFYYYSADMLRARCERLRKLMPAGMQLSYSIKANPHAGVVRLLSSIVDGLDVASAAEMRLALSAGLPAERISIAGPGKTDEALRAACAAGVLISLESAGEAERVADIATACGRRPPVLLRLNPPFQLRGSGIRMGGGPQVFGVDVEAAPELLARLPGDRVDFRGFHLFAGSQCLMPDAIEESLLRGLESMAELAAAAPATPRLLLFGGGFGVPYFRGDLPLSDTSLRDLLARLDERTRQLLPDSLVQLELGRYLVAGAGFYVTRIVDRKLSRDSVFLVTDGGMNHNLAASGNLGQVVRRDFPIVIGNRVAADSQEEVIVAGPLCTPLDVLANQTRLPKAGPGDLVVVLQAGAYGLTASPVDFLGHPRPAELLG